MSLRLSEWHGWRINLYWSNLSIDQQSDNAECTLKVGPTWYKNPCWQKPSLGPRILSQQYAWALWRRVTRRKSESWGLAMSRVPAKVALAPPRTPRGNAAPRHTYLQERRWGSSGVGGRPHLFGWVMCTGHPPESHLREADHYRPGHCVPRTSVLGVSVALCSLLLGRFPQDLPRPGTEGRRARPPPPRALHPLGRIRRCRNEWWLALGNWPALFPRNSANILDALKWVNKVWYLRKENTALMNLKESWTPSRGSFSPPEAANSQPSSLILPSLHTAFVGWLVGWFSSHQNTKLWADEGNW